MCISAIDDTCNILAGRPYGGVAILIRKHLRPFCEFVLYDDPCMMVLEVKHFNDNLYFINVYLPYQCHDNSPISRVVIGRKVDYRLIYVRYCLTNTTLCLLRSYDCTLACNYI